MNFSFPMQLKFPRKLIPVLLFLTTFGLFLSSCVVTKKTVYFSNLPDSVRGVSVLPAEFKEPVIQTDDILSINIQTIDPESTAAVNQVSVAMPAVGISSASAIGNQTVAGFLVDKEGTIEISMIGKVKVAGLTTFQARELIRTKAQRYFHNPTVHVRFANFKVTVIGEVAKPATYTVPNEKVSLLDAIGLAGDLTIYGKRENILLVRENNGKKEFERFNLNSSDIFQSPYFYLKQNDVIYVEPNKAKVATTNAARTQTISLIGSAISVLIVLFSRVNF